MVNNNNNNNLYQLQKLKNLLKNNNVVKKSILQGTIISSITIISYLLIVVFTSPNLPATASISAALQVNSSIIIGLAIGTGIQGFVISYRRKVIDSNNCEIKINKKKAFLRSSSTGNGFGAALSSFFSFFSLVPLGCCGSWIFILSYLPMVFGNSASVFMIKYSNILSYVGLIIISAITLIAILKLYKDLKTSKSNKILIEGEQGNSR
ncbi:MAG TPA: hypothetical protein VJ583_04980 [Nitrososphaeraceae archaeon]|nr:hypothetical protein [Nitrososphaeraceae archaeon]